VEWRQALVALGSNSGDRLKHLSRGLARLVEDDRVRLVCVSGVYETEAQEKAAGGKPFYNAVAHLSTVCGPEELARLLGEIERKSGRDEDRRRPDGSRRLDLDLLYLGDVVCDSGGLRLPHPRRLQRDFVLAPAAEVAPGFLDPEEGRTVAELWENLKRQPVHHLRRTRPFSIENRRP